MEDPFEVVIAHQGGWDELFLFVIPIVVAIGAVRWVERRHRKEARTESDSRTDQAEDGEGS